MSFDLYFCTRRNDGADFQEVARWAMSLENFRETEDQLYYANEYTGVYFELDRETELGPEIALPQGYYSARISFHLNYLRPSYFAQEAMPIVEQLAKEFELSALNLQMSASEEMADAPTSVRLIEEWTKDNQWAIGAAKIDSPNAVRWMPSKSAMEMWEYNRVRNAMEKAFGPDVFVPKLVAATKKGFSDAFRFFTFTSGIPTIIPASDTVVLVDRQKRFLGLKESVVIRPISMKSFENALGPMLEKIIRGSIAVRKINDNSLGEAIKRLRAIDDEFPQHELEVIGWDSFVDVPREL